MGNQERPNPEMHDLLSQENDNKFNLILYNDEVNTFDYVIESLIEVCHHENHQAEQCAFITHYKGKCDVKKGEFEELSFMKSRLSSKGLTVSIE